MLVWAQTPELSAEFRGIFMSLRTRLALPAIVSALAILAGCGGSGSPIVTPPPSGGFANNNLSGTYVFSATGTDINNNLVTMMGTFSADGKGNITAGVVDQNGTSGTVVSEAAVTSGTYSVGADGRPTGSSSVPTGLLTLQTSVGPYSFDFVLTASEHGLITEFDTNGSASGTLDLQSAVTQADVNGQSYAFNFTGADGVGGSLCGSATGGSVVPFSAVGAFTLDGNGNISGGTEDQNNNCISSGLTDIAITAGSVTLPQGATFDTATITTGSGPSAVTYSFDVFPISATHLKFIEMDGTPTVVGDAFPQGSSIQAGNYVFSVAGFDSLVPGPFTGAGLIVTDGSGNVTNASAEDINDAGVVSEVTGFTGFYSSLTGGRSVFTLTGFANGNNGVACSSCVFAVYPSSGGLQMLEIDDGGMTNGVAYTQTAGPTLASGEGYGLNLSGATPNSAEDDIVEFTNNNGTFGPGIIDFNDQGTTSFKNTFNSSYVADGTVPGRGTVTPSNSNGYLLTTYTVDSNTTVAVSTDPNYVALGALVKQNATAKSNVAVTHLSVLRAARTVAARTKRTVKR
jgi:hypothetical protein